MIRNREGYRDAMTRAQQGAAWAYRSAVMIAASKYQPRGAFRPSYLGLKGMCRDQIAEARELRLRNDGLI